jgi:LPXTG-motif cell wall-anchored protein
MAKVLSALAFVSLVALAAPAFADQNGQGQNGNSQGGGGSRAAPAPEIGASLIGMVLAGGIAIYARRRRRP